ncbi:MAG: O-antigen ligase family protein, partial [Spirochaetales bacterium]|nr:O-antigen ligase family protein [Candidatus Physcosoma equi]
VILIAVVSLFFYNGDTRLLKEVSDILHLKLSDNAGSGRGYLWKTSFKLSLRNPIFGTGPGTFTATYHPYDRFKTITDFAHNDFLQNAVNIGLVGAGIYIIFVFTLAFRALKNANDSKFIVILASGAAAYLAHSFFSFSIAIITPMFWVAAGMLEHEIQKVEDRRKEEKEAKEQEA